MPRRPLAVMAAVLFCAQCTSAAPPAPPSAGESGVTLSPDMPTDLPTSPSQADAVAFAWRSFVAVNWPAVAGQRGVPDTTRTIGEAGVTVRDTWKHPAEVFLPDGATPPGWGASGGTLPPACGSAGAGAGALVLYRTSKAPDDPSNPVFASVDQAVGGTLTDQHGNLARFDITFNETSFDYIVDNTLYNVQGQQAFGSIDFGDGVVETKAAWRELTDADSPDAKARFYQRTAWIYDPPSVNGPATCRQALMGLVGLHIAQKTPSRPQWTWATFEQVDNVPPFGTENAGAYPYSFNDPACDSCPPNQSTEQGRDPSTPTQAARLIDIGSDAQTANPLWQQALAAAVAGSVWQYYELVDIQWPARPEQAPYGSPNPFLNANTTMETYVRSSSCVGCHYSARTADNRKPSDFSYMLAEAKSATGGER